MARALLISLIALVLPATASAAPTFFQSPTQNIGCVIVSSGVRCDIRERDWQPPSRPASCSLDWGNGLDLRRTGSARFTCAGDTVLGMGRTLAYGRSIKRFGFACKSRKNGMRCRNARNGRGFSLSRQRVRRF